MESEGFVGESLAFDLLLPSDFEADLPLDGATVAVFLPGAWVDADGNGAPSKNDQYVSSELDLLMWVEGSPGATLSSLGARTGWNRARVDPSATSLTIESAWAWDPEDGLDLKANLLNHAPTHLAVQPEDAKTTADVVMLRSQAGTCTGGPYPSEETFLFAAVDPSLPYVVPLPPETPEADLFDPEPVIACDFNADWTDVAVASFRVSALRNPNGSATFDGDEEEAAYSVTSRGYSQPVWLAATGLLAGRIPERGGGVPVQVLSTE